jgi:hypothetical protein
VESGDRNYIRLMNSNIGFALEVNRASDLGFPSSYALSARGIADHACVAFQEFEDDRTRKIRGMTAAVLLKTIFQLSLRYIANQSIDH